MAETAQSMASALAKEKGLPDPSEPYTVTFEEFAPKAPDGTVWWVYATLDSTKLATSDNGWSVVKRTCVTQKGEWTDA